VFLNPPAGYADANVVFRLCKPVYDLVPAPKAWYDRLCEVVRRHGFTSDLSDEAIFRLCDRDENINGILAAHVDDTVGGALAVFHGLMEEGCS
jgi:hypothetical protein